MPPVNYVADFGGGAMFLVTGVLAALLHARSTGTGQVVDAAMTEGAAYLGSMTRTFLAMGGWKDERGANMLDGGAPNYRCYETRRRQVGRGRALEPQFWAALVDDAGPGRRTRRRLTTRRSGPPARRCSPATFRDPHARRVGRDLRAARRVRRARPHSGGGAAHPHNVARGLVHRRRGATLAAPAPKFSATPGETGAITADRRADAEVHCRGRLRARTTSAALRAA